MRLNACIRCNFAPGRSDVMFSRALLVTRRASNIGRTFSLSVMASTKVAVVLSGCGVYDGSEVHEASACLVHLSRAGTEISMFAPDVEQMHAIDHTKGEPMPANRNVLVESARIGRGNIKALSEIKADDFDALVIPGGFGAAKNLCDWAVKNVDCTLNADVEKAIKQFHSMKKPIGLCCIAPVLAAKCIPGVELTVGKTEEDGGKWPYAGTAAALEKCGAKHVVTEVTEAHVDAANKVVTTAAFMHEGPFYLIHDGVGQMISKVLQLAKQSC